MRLATIATRGHHARMKRSHRSGFRMQRLARSASARVFAYAMAVLLVMTSFSAWAMPAAHAAQSEVQADALGSAHHHCDEAGANTSADTKQAPHGKGCPCCVGGACACLYPCSIAANAELSGFIPVPAVQSLPPPGASFTDATGTRRLRPPIG